MRHLRKPTVTNLLQTLEWQKFRTRFEPNRKSRPLLIRRQREEASNCAASGQIRLSLRQLRLSWTTDCRKTIEELDLEAEKLPVPLAHWPGYSCQIRNIRLESKHIHVDIRRYTHTYIGHGACIVHAYSSFHQNTLLKFKIVFALLQSHILGETDAIEIWNSSNFKGIEKACGRIPGRRRRW